LSDRVGLSIIGQIAAPDDQQPKRNWKKKVLYEKIGKSCRMSGENNREKIQVKLQSPTRQGTTTVHPLSSSTPTTEQALVSGLVYIFVALI
jgi:hypothetical protein